MSKPAYNTKIHRQRSRYLKENEIMCGHCGQERAVEVDHIIPLALGGTDHDGWIPSCKRCNRKRGAILGATITNAIKRGAYIPSRVLSEGDGGIPTYQLPRWTATNNKRVVDGEGGEEPGGSFEPPIPIRPLGGVSTVDEARAAVKAGLGAANAVVCKQELSSRRVVPGALGVPDVGRILPDMPPCGSLPADRSGLA